MGDAAPFCQHWCFWRSRGTPMGLPGGLPGGHTHVSVALQGPLNSKHPPQYALPASIRGQSTAEAVALALHQCCFVLQDGKGLLQALVLGRTAFRALLIGLRLRDASLLQLAVILIDC